MKKFILLFTKFFFLNGIIYGLTYGTYSTFLKLSNYSTTRLFNILLITVTIKIILLAVAFILTIKILSRKNQEAVHGNISKLILATVFLQLTLGIIFAFFYLNSIQLPAAYHTPIYVYITIICLSNYLLLNIIYSVFILKKHIKIFIAIISLLLVVYITNISIYKINFNKNYKNADIQENFYLYPKTDISNIFKNNIAQNGNSAETMIELFNALNDREQLKDDAEKNAPGYIEPTENDLKILSRINQAKYISLSEKYIPDDIILCRECMILPLNNLRAFSRGVIKTADEQISQNQYSKAIDSLNHLLLFGDRLVRDKDDGLITRLVGISMAKLSAEKLIELNQNTEELKQYLTELEDIKNSTSQLTKLELSVGDDFFSSKNSATYFKFYDRYKSIIFPDSIIKYTFYNMDVPIIWPSLGYVGFLEESGASIGESLISMVSGTLVKINIGKNYTFYNKAIEIQKSQNNKTLDYYMGNDTLTIIKKYGSEMSKTLEIGNELILK